MASMSEESLNSEHFERDNRKGVDAFSSNAALFLNGSTAPTVYCIHTGSTYGSWYKCNKIMP